MGLIKLIQLVIETNFMVSKTNDWTGSILLEKFKDFESQNFVIFSAKYLCAKKWKIAERVFKLDQHKGAQFKKGIK